MAVLLTLATATAGGVGTAVAKDIRYPEIGPVAFLLHLPDSWSVRTVGSPAAIVAIGPDSSQAISVLVIPENAGSSQKTPDELATALLAAMHAQPFNKHEKGTISGVPADSYYSWKARASDGQQQSVTMNLIKSHGSIVLETIIADLPPNSAQQAALAAALKGIKLTGVGSNPASTKGPTNPARPAVASIPVPTEAPSSTAQTGAPSNAARIEIPLKPDGGTFVVPVFINGAITLNFVVDSGAADVAVPADVVGTLIRTGTIEKSDMMGKQKYVLADGSISPTVTFNIRSLKVGDVLIENVKGSVSPAAGSLLLGQSFLQRFKSWSMDNNKHVLVLEQ
jgi:clan AA aspartic protease (TIGR02281 family)